MEERERTKVVVDETTIYEIDLDCYECRDEKNKVSGESGKRNEK